MKPYVVIVNWASGRETIYYSRAETPEAAARAPLSSEARASDALECWAHEWPEGIDPPRVKGSNSVCFRLKGAAYVEALKSALEPSQGPAKPPNEYRPWIRQSA